MSFTATKRSIPASRAVSCSTASVLLLSFVAFTVMPEAVEAQSGSGVKGQPTAERPLGLGDELPDVYPGSRRERQKFELYRENNQVTQDGHWLRYPPPPPPYTRDIQEGNYRQYGLSPYPYPYSGYGYGYGIGYGFSPYYAGWAPWGAAPRSLKYKDMYYEPGRTGYIPQLELRSYDPYGWESGIRTPIDTDPLGDYRLPPFEGVVAAAKRKMRESVAVQGSGEALSLMKAGKYRQAGRVLAKGFEKTASPRYPLMLAEVFFALGKKAHAELLLENALSSDGVSLFLPRDVAAHFPSRDEYEKLLAKRMQDKEWTILHAYLLLFSKEPMKGLDLLQGFITENPKDEAASLLYRHYLPHVFGAALEEDRENNPDKQDGVKG